MSKAVTTAQSKSRIERDWKRLLEKAENVPALDLTYIDRLNDEPVKDELVRLPYEGTPPSSNLWQ